MDFVSAAQTKVIKTNKKQRIHAARWNRHARRNRKIVDKALDIWFWERFRKGKRGKFGIEY